MATIAALRKQVLALGFPKPFILKQSPTELQDLIDQTNGASAKPRKKSATKAAVRKAASAPKKRGRPVGSKNKTKNVAQVTHAISKSASAKSKPAAKSTQGKAKRSTAVSTQKKGKSDLLVTRNYTKKEVEPTDGRYTLDAIDYTVAEGWNPRVDSVPYLIQKALRRFRGNRQKVFEFLYDQGLWEFVGRNKQDGKRRTEAEGIAMLKYRIARTDWDFAMKTGQHEKSENRIEYGTGENATVRAKKPTPKKRTTAAKKPAARKATAKKAVTRKPVAKKPVKKTVQKPVRRRVTARKASARK